MFAEQVAPGRGFFDLLEPGERTAIENFSALLARRGADVDDPIGMANYVEVVLDDEQ